MVYILHMRQGSAQKIPSEWIHSLGISVFVIV